MKFKCDSILAEVKNDNISWENAIFQNSTNPIAGGIIFNQSSGDMYWDMKNIDKSYLFGPGSRILFYVESVSEFLLVGMIRILIFIRWSDPYPTYLSPDPDIVLF